MIKILVAVLLLVVLATSASADVSAKITLRISEYTLAIDNTRSAIEQGILQIEQLKQQLNQLVGARHSLEELQKEMLSEQEGMGGDES